MPGAGSNSHADPYQPLASNLKSGDAINGFLLGRPRRQIVQLLSGRRVLDIGSGTGSLAAMLSAAGCQVVGIDRSPTMLAFARSRPTGAEFHEMDAANLPFHEEFDAAVISLALHEMSMPTRAAVWASMRRAVRKQGRLIALDYDVPRRASLASRIATALIEQDERSLLTIDREHYSNFSLFMRRGGLSAWVRECGDAVESEFAYWAGTIRVAVCRRGESV